MKLLLDTCAFLWIITGSNKLSNKAKEAFQDPDNEVYLSTISLWEILIKNKLGKLPLPDIPEQFLLEQTQLHRIMSLPLEEMAVMQLLRLPDYHQDPFDRMLICQAIATGLTILTPDILIKQYPILTFW